jgi:hypothetical protein
MTAAERDALVADGKAALNVAAQKIDALAAAIVVEGEPPPPPPPPPGPGR